MPIRRDRLADVLALAGSAGCLPSVRPVDGLAQAHDHHLPPLRPVRRAGPRGPVSRDGQGKPIAWPRPGDWLRKVRGVRGEKAVQLCFGNYGGQTIQTGFFRELLPFFNALACDHLVLEFARRGYDELEVFRDLKPSIALGVGVIDIKDNETETPTEVARRIEQAVKVLGAERIRWVHPDCGFWMVLRSVADRKMRALVEGRNLYHGSPA